MNKKKQLFFDELLKRAELLEQNRIRDNEASRHDQLVYPIITSEFGLGWKPTDLISQSTINVPKIITESHIFRDAIPKLRKPDILICPYGFDKNIVIIEEKKKQLNLKQLNEHRLQIREYQALYECTWGILTDGERWIIKRNFETFHEFSSILELMSGIDDLRNSIGRISIINRLSKYNTTDILLFVTESSIIDNSGNLDGKNKLFGFDNKISVIICGVNGREVSNSGTGYEIFPNLEMAIYSFPDLHPMIPTKRFTSAMLEKKNGKVVKLRFETWKAFELYST